MSLSDTFRATSAIWNPSKYHKI